MNLYPIKYNYNIYIHSNIIYYFYFLYYYINIKCTLYKKNILIIS